MRFNFGINQIVVQTNEKKEFIIITVKSGFYKRYEMCDKIVNSYRR